MGPDSDFLYDKARAIISCYLSSDVPPRIQVCNSNEWTFRSLSFWWVHFHF